MTDKKISQLDLVTGVSPTDEMIINVGGGDDATTSRVSLGTLLGGNEVSGIQYSAVWSSSMPGSLGSREFSGSFIEESPDPNNPDVTTPIFDWITTSVDVPVPENADGAIIIAYSATSSTPSKGLIDHPAAQTGSEEHTSIGTKLAHRFYVKEEDGNPVIMDPDFSGEPGMMGWTDTHNISMRITTNTVADNDVGNQKRSQFISVKQITKIGFCRFTPGQSKITMDYKLHIYRAEFQVLDNRPIRFIVLPTQGITAVATTGQVPVEDPFVPYSIQDINDEVAALQSKEIRHIMTMMDSYEKAYGSDITGFDSIRAGLLDLGKSTNTNTQKQNGEAIKGYKIEASALMDFDFGYDTTTQFGLLY